MTSSDRSGVLTRIAIVAIFLATWVLTFSVATWVLSGEAKAQGPSPSGDLKFNRGDLNFVLKQIKIAEEHSLLGGSCEALASILPNLSAPLGLRTVDGACNNLIPGQENFGRADEVFVESLLRDFPDADNGTSYDSGMTVMDSTPRLISNLIINQTTANPAAVIAAAEEDGTDVGTDISGFNQFLIPNTAPDEGLSAPFNAFMTFFGQFFDHGLDLVNKGGNGVVMMRVPEDDPLFDPTPGAANMMLMPRASRMAGPDGVQGTNDDVPDFINATTPHVDQQQTYASHASSHILLRHYELVVINGQLRPVSSGRLLNSYGIDGVLDNGDDGAMATWDTAQAQGALKLGLDLDDGDGNNVPMILSDVYGKFTPGPLRGMPQLVTGFDGNGQPNLLEGNLAAPVDASLALRVNQSFFLDVAHSANPGGKTPDVDVVLNPRIDILSGQTTRGIRADSPAGTYDDELLGRHFICGDGRCNENIALTTIHHIFHSEHNRLVEVTKRVILDTGDLAFLNEWLDTSVVVLPAYTAPPGLASDASLVNQAATRIAVNSLGLDWNGERLFQAARFGTEMQYNRVVFDEFVPTLSGLKDDFEGFHTNEDPSISSEFAQSVYRFGHSMLTETVDRYDADFATITDAGAVNPGTASDQLGLFEAFLNPLAWNNSDANGVPTLNAEEAAGTVIRGLTRATANQIDEFVTGGMQNNLVGLPLDIGAINIARGRDVGNPKLNAAREMFHARVGTEQLLPYKSWMDYGDNMRHEASLINFIAAYGTHPSIVAGNTYAGRRAAACAIVGQLTGDPATYCATHNWGAAPTPADALDFLFSRGTWATPLGEKITTGVDDVDFWVGGLVEERQPFGGHLGATHNYVFENQMERLQNGDRFYYVGRTKGTGMNFFNELESNSFTALAMRNSDMGEFGAGTLPLNLFAVANFYMEVDQTQQFNTDLGSADPEAESELFAFWIRDADLSTTNIEVVDPNLFLQTTGGDHYTVGGTPGDDTIIGGIGDDNLWGRAGNDRIEGGDGADLIEGGLGDDIITDLGGPDVIEGGPGNDVIFSGNEEDVVFGDEGDDFIVNSSEHLEGFGGEGNDWFLTGIHIDGIIGGPGDDWLEELGGGENIHCMDNCKVPEAGEPAIKGNDVYIAYGGNNDMDMENGDDIMIDGPGIERMEGQLGFDWASFQNNDLGVNVDLDLTIFLRPTLPPSNDTIANRYDRVEGLSGSAHGDVLRGTPNSPTASNGNELTNFALIEGLDDLVPNEERRDLPNDPITGEAQFGWTGGEIILGGGSSDLLVGEGGDDIMDGDSSLATGILTPNPETRNGDLAQALAAAQAATANAAAAQSAAQATAAASAAQAATDQAAAAPLNATAAAAQTQADLLQGAAVMALSAQLAAEQNAASAQAQATSDATAATAAQTAVGQAQAASAAAQAAAAPALATAAAAQGTAAAAAADATATAAAAGTANAASAQAAADAVAAQADAIAALIGAFLGQNSFMDFMVAMDAATAAGDVAAAAAVTAASAQATADVAAAANTQAQTELAAANTAAAAALVAVTTTAAEVIAATDAANAAQLAAAASAAAVAPAVAAAAQAQVVSAAAIALANQVQTGANTAQATASAAQDVADASAAQSASDQQALDIANTVVVAANAQLVAAQTSMALADEFIIVAGMQDIMNAVLAGTINPGELSISRVISDADELDVDTDIVLYTGESADYEVESDELGNIADINGDGFIEVLDTRPLIANLVASKNGNEGRDLVRNVERLVFADTTRPVPAGVAGAADSDNSVAVGQPTISGTPEVDMTLTASLANVTDADNVSAVPAGSVSPDGADFIWESELEPNSNFFSPIRRLEGIGANGDAIQVQGDTMVVTTAEAGRRVRVTVIFQDEAEVFEVVTSAPVTIENCPGCVIPAELLADLPASFIGTVGDIDGDTAIFENRSAAGAARIEAVIPEVPLDLFENTGFGAVIVALDEIEVDRILLTFISISEGVTGGGFVPQIVAFEILDGAGNPTGMISQDEVEIQWDFRGAAVAPLVRGLTRAVITVDGVEVANQLFFGDSSVDDATGVVLVLTAEELAAAAALEVALALGNPLLVTMAETSLEAAVASSRAAAAAAAAAAADTILLPASSGNTDRRGRIRLDGVCVGGGRAETTTRRVRCSSERDGSYSCRGRGLAPFTSVVVTCRGGSAAAPSTAAVVASSVADSRGTVRISGTCSSGEASAAGLRCSTRRSGGFSCRGRGFATGEEVSVTCQ